ncbi:MAG TPA: recombination protein RecR [Acholeplasma sp.]|jgi:recombination protein RecR|nr:recombination protein RecR [Acholeplasma sp.]
MYPDILKKVIEDFQKLPGIGEKTAERLAVFVATNLEHEDVLNFSEDLIKLKKELRACKVSHVLTDQEISPIIMDPTREQDVLMVVSDSKDVFMMEKMGTYRGQYHVLGGLIDFSKGITDKDLTIDSLSLRIKNFKEMIIATNSTVEGEMTAKFLKQLYQSEPLTITRLAYGLPVGTDFKYADMLTLSKAVENRKPFE